MKKYQKFNKKILSSLYYKLYNVNKFIHLIWLRVRDFFPLILPTENMCHKAYDISLKPTNEILLALAQNSHLKKTFFYWSIKSECFVHVLFLLVLLNQKYISWQLVDATFALNIILIRIHLYYQIGKKILKLYIYLVDRILAKLSTGGKQCKFQYTVLSR